MSLTVAGAGAFGTALAIALGAKGPVTLWARDEEAAQAMQAARENARRLPGASFPETLTITADPDALSADTVLLAVPAQALRGFLDTHRARLDGAALVACSKGIDLTTGEGPTGTLRAAMPGATTAVLTGPSFAADIARGLPTALTLACADAGAEALQRALSTPALRLYRTDDTTGAELGGALKNVIAIACGTCIGAGFGQSARAALMTRGFAEMQRIALALGARPETLAGLSGFGDLTLTCTSDGSRNYRHGLALGRGEAGETGTVEGVATARAVTVLAAKHGLDLPICNVVEALVDTRIGPEEALDRLLSRPLKEE